MPTGAIRGNGDCTACGACANVCATAALKLKEERDRTLEFTPALCVNCGACVKVCLPGFLHAAPSTLETISTTPVILFQGGVGTCKRCKAGSAILSNQEGYCPVCLHKMKMMNSL
jgi:ferredoxin